ncbi:hypothetical protein D7X55_22590 [Corallococcus sp. AB049A]|uniref:Uncharacterized protein n=1 Tax=Corallococcus interemptor TaxID=2316720 RepID=A0A3A8Q640_9BACT|nr:MULTISPECIES: hypothetical protein [Corallococcus]RKH43447.1 hypothetical protein D7Y23_29295 [Corallococcus sp. AB050B]RKH58734.1 hypothetical protein D7X96_36495 [Corallococcus interemptor]RKI61978.1 hypothetical protein D7X55_22590 [Corallococcus sp. AB049A]
MPRLVLIGAEQFPHLSDVLHHEARRADAPLTDISVEAWGTSATPWVEVKDGRLRAGLLGAAPSSGAGDDALGPEDVLWCLFEKPFPPTQSPYLDTEHEALRDGFHTCCPARSINRRGLLAPLWTMAVWRLLALRLPVRQEDSVLRAPHFHLGPCPEDGRRWKPWPREAEFSRAEVWWTVPAPGALHLAVVMGSRVTLWPLEAPDGGGVRPPPGLEADLLQLAAACGADVLEVLLVPSTDSGGDAGWTVLQLSALPEELETLLAREHPEARAQVEHFVRSLLQGQEVAR